MESMMKRIRILLFLLIIELSMTMTYDLSSGQKFIGRYASLGCWKDVPTRAIASLEHHFPEQYNVRINPIQKCFEVAMSFGYQVFAVQDGGQCFGSPTAQNTYAKYGSSRYCSYGTGGPMANNVYRMKNVYKVPSQPSACGILQVVDGYIGHNGQYSALHEGCHCAGFAATVCKSMCDRDDECKGYSEVADGYEVSSGCQIATNSSCYSGCIKTNLGNLGDLVQDRGHGGMFGGCFIRTLDSSGDPIEK